MSPVAPLGGSGVKPDQPSLLTLPAPSPLPGRISPEQPVECAEPFDADGWLFSIDWAGCRALLFAEPDGSIRLQGERLEEITGSFPELAAAGAALGGRSAVLDGVIAVLDGEGRPDLEALCRRPATGPAGAPSAVFLATDVLHLDGAPTMGRPLTWRLEALAALVRGDARIQLTEPAEGEGIALAAAGAERGLDAVLARRGSAPYRPGVASPDRLRIGLTRQAGCVVTGVVSRAPGWGERLLTLAEHDGGRLVRSAAVAATLDGATAAWLDRVVQQCAIDRSLDGGPEPAGATWLRPQLVATVRHAGRHSDGSLIEPALRALRTDVNPSWCRRRPPVAPPTSGRRLSPFRPTVLASLPMTAD